MVDLKPSSVSIFTIHNKNKDKIGMLPDNINYVADQNIPDFWICYPQDAYNITEHTKLANDQWCGIKKDFDLNVF
jgi:hypoxanthine phosphoribosyltransferase